MLEITDFSVFFYGKIFLDYEGKYNSCPISRNNIQWLPNVEKEYKQTGLNVLNAFYNSCQIFRKDHLIAVKCLERILH